MDRPAGRACVRRGLLAVAALAAAFAVAPAAGAHATLTTTEPANDAVLEQAPRQVVTLHFNEPVETVFGSLRAYDSEASRVERRPGHAAGREERSPSARRTTIRPPARTPPRGASSSADGHPISGAFVFHVGAPSANAAGVADEVDEGGAPRSADRALHRGPLPRLRPAVPGRRRRGGGRVRASAPAEATLTRGLLLTLGFAAVALAVVACARDRAAGRGRGSLRPRRGHTAEQHPVGSGDALRPRCAGAGAGGAR